MATSVDTLFETAAAEAARFRDSLATRPPNATADVTALRAAFDGPLPEQPSAADGVIRALADAADPGLMGVAGPRFFGWVMGGSHPAGIAADWLTGAWGQNAGNYYVAPAAAVAEEVAGRWLLEILDLPREASVGFVTGATMASFVALVAARDDVLRRIGYDVGARGLAGSPPIAVFAGADAHATIFAGLKYLGIGRDQVTWIATDHEGRMLPDALATALAGTDGPKIVIAQAGQINTGAFDPFDRIVPICRASGAWLHVDGAFGLWARASKSLAALAKDVDGADSWSTDGHKWLQLPFDSGFVIIRDADAHRRAMAFTASYLPVDEHSGRDPSHYVPELSRRARGFAAWAVFKTLGRAGVDQLVTRHSAFARRLADRLRPVDGIRILNDVVLNQVIIGFGCSGSPDALDEATRAVLDLLAGDNRILVRGARWHDRWVMRFSVISAATEEADIDFAADCICDAWATVRTSLASAKPDTGRRAG